MLANLEETFDRVPTNLLKLVKQSAKIPNVLVRAVANQYVGMVKSWG